MIEMGILDPAKVLELRSGAASIAGLMITTEAMVTDVAERVLRQLHQIWAVWAVWVAWAA